MGKLKASKKSLANHGSPLSEDEFKIMVKEAEKGPFYNMQETSQLIEKWKAKHAK